MEDAPSSQTDAPSSQTDAPSSQTDAPSSQTDAPPDSTEPVDSLPPHRVAFRVLLLATAGGVAGLAGMLTSDSLFGSAPVSFGLERVAQLWSFYASWCGVLVAAECVVRRLSPFKGRAALLAFGCASVFAMGGAMTASEALLGSGPQEAWLRLVAFLRDALAPSFSGAGMLAAVAIPFVALGSVRLEFGGLRFSGTVQLVTAAIASAIGYAVLAGTTPFPLGQSMFDLEGVAFFSLGTAAAAGGMRFGEWVEARSLAALERRRLASA